MEVFIKKQRFILLLLFVFIAYNISNAQWVQMSSGLNRGDIRGIAANSSRIIAVANYSGVVYSTNSGQNWSLTSLYRSTPTSVILNDSVCLSGSANGISYSTNGGQNWNTSSGGGISILCFCFSGQYCISGSAGAGILISTDKGHTWPYHKLTDEYIYSLASSGANVYAGTNNGVFYSSNNGFDWVDIFSDKKVLSLTLSGSNIFAGTDSNGVYFSSNNGSSWVQTSLNNKCITALTSINQYILAGTNNGVYLSSNNGINWSNNGLMNNYITSFWVNDGKIYLGSRDSLGIYVSTNNGLNWSGMNLHSIIIESMVLVNNKIFVGTNYGIFYSTNEGENWLPTSFYKMDIRSLAYIGQNVIFAGTDTGLFRSTDEGLTWSLFRFQNTRIYSLYFLNNYIFAGSYVPGRIYRSSNLGLNWDTVFSQANLVNCFAHTNINNDIKIYAATTWSFGSYNGVLFSTNMGVTWNNMLFSQGHFSTVSAISSNVLAGSMPSGIGTYGAYMSANNGANWLFTSNGIIISSIAYENKFVIGTHDNILYSNNFGSSWNSNTNGMGNITVYSLFSNNNYIYAGTWGWGLFRINKDILVDFKNISLKVPDKFCIYQNFPNPFNPITKIRYYIPKTTNIRLTVYNLLGKEISILVNENVVPGTYETEFNGENYPSGIYFYRLETPDFVQTYKMILLK